MPLKYIILAIFCLEIPININTSYYEKGALVINKLLIIKKYIKGEFIIDIVSISVFLNMFVEEEV